jgi:hypothetical protein
VQTEERENFPYRLSGIKINIKERQNRHKRDYKIMEIKELIQPIPFLFNPHLKTGLEALMFKYFVPLMSLHSL